MKIKLSLLTAVLLAFSLALTAQEEAPAAAASPMRLTYSGPAYRGWSARLDVASPLMGLLSGQVYTAEAQFDINLYRQLYPTIEVGYTTAQKEYPSGAGYRTDAPFFRIGVNYSFFGPYNRDGKPRNAKSYPFVGVRYGFSFMNYHLSNIPAVDPYWGTTELRDFRSNFTYSGWLEVAGGVNIDIANGFTMGWAVRLKLLVHTSAPSTDYVWYVPGYGRTDASNFTFNYTIGYTFYSKDYNK